MKLIKSVIRSNIFLASAAVLLTVSSQVQLGLKPVWQPILLLIFIATFIVYNPHVLVKFLFRKQPSGRSLKEDIYRNIKVLNLFVFLLSTMVFVLFTVSDIQVLITLFVMGSLTLLYSLTVSEKKIFKLREIPYLKIFMIVSVWSVSTVILPVFQTGTDIFSLKVLLVFMERFFFIFAIAIQFDIRDMHADRQAGLKTIPILINRNNSMVLAYFSLLASFLISFFHYRVYNEWFVTGALGISILSTWLFMKMNFSNSFKKYYYTVLDGTMALQGALVLGFYIFSNH